MKIWMPAVFAVCCAGTSFAQSGSVSGDLTAFFNQVKNNVVRAAEKMPEEHYGFRPAPEVKTFGGMLGHIADANFSICANASGTPRPAVQVEKTKTAKADIVAALKEAFAFCDAAYGRLSDPAWSAETIKLYGGQRTRAGALILNYGHTFEHYGNLVTYMRMKGLVPPSSER